MLEEFIQLTGRTSGPISIILAGVHGNEKPGIEAVGKILSNLEIEKGQVLFGYGNPRAIEANQRFVDANLNRLFISDDLLLENDKESYEYGRAQFLKKYLNQAEALLDVHASSIPKTKAFVICEKNAEEIVKYLPTDVVVSGFDEAEPGGTDYYMNSIGRIGICLECGYIDDPRSVQLAEECIFAFLAARGHISRNIISRKQSRVHVYSKYYTKTDDFTLSKPFENFELVEAGQILGIDGKEEIRASKQSFILFAHNSKKVGSEAFLLGE